MKSKRDDEINKSILEWLLVKNYKTSAEIFMQETNLQISDLYRKKYLIQKFK